MALTMLGDINGITMARKGPGSLKRSNLVIAVKAGTVDKF